MDGILTVVVYLGMTFFDVFKRMPKNEVTIPLGQRVASPERQTQRNVWDGDFLIESAINFWPSHSGLKHGDVPETRAQALRIFGFTERDADQDDVLKARFRELHRKLNPDTHLDASPDMKELLTSITCQINAAYQILTRKQVEKSRMMERSREELLQDLENATHIGEITRALKILNAYGYKLDIAPKPHDPICFSDPRQLLDLIKRIRVK